MHLRNSSLQIRAGALPLLIAFLAFLGTLYAEAQIVNVELNRLDHDSLGLQGIGELQVYNVKNTSNTLKANGSIQLQHVNQRSIYLFVSEAHLILSKSDKLEQEAHGHFRYGHKIAEWLIWEGFLQTQVDQVLGIRNRTLLGSGPKLRLVGDSSKMAFTGASAMYEHLEELGTGIIRNQIRLNGFVSARLIGKNDLSAYGIFYAQPLLSNFSDYRLQGTFSLTFMATSHLGFTSKISFSYNSNPVEKDNVVPFNYKLSQGLSFLF